MRSARDLVHPNDDVNLGQSSNDVIPTAMHLANLAELQEVLIPAIQHLRDVLDDKSKEFWPIIKTGRTHLQDATPIRLGQEFQGYAGQMDRALQRLAAASQELQEVALGGTAVGTGINMHPEFPRRVCEIINERTGLGVRETSNHFQAQSTIDNVVAASGAVRTVAVSLLKIANDVRWMGSGPRAGIGELDVPAVQPGSSIMPGKVNPVIAESLSQVCAMVIGNDVAIVMAGQSGNFELNMMLPLATRNLLHSIRYSGTATRNFADNLVAGLKATSRGPDLVESGLMLVTALAPEIGYAAAAALAKEAFATGRTIRDLARERTSLSETDLDRILDPAAMVEPGPLLRPSPRRTSPNQDFAPGLTRRSAGGGLRTPEATCVAAQELVSQLRQPVGSDRFADLLHQLLDEVQVVQAAERIRQQLVCGEQVPQIAAGEAGAARVAAAVSLDRAADLP